MAITQVSFDSENKVMEYTGLPTDAKSGYPSTCGAGSRLALLNAVSGKLSSELMFDGVDWNYIQKNITLEDLVLYNVIHPTGAKLDTFTMNLEDKMVRNYEMAVVDTDAITVAVANVPRDCKITLFLDYGATASITWFSGITWATAQPTWTSGHKYKVEFITKDGGTHWYASAISW